MRSSSNQGGDWTDPEIAKFINRQKRLEKIGMTEDESEKLAQTLLYRDRPGSDDDRRLCLECASWKKSACISRAADRCPIPTVLQRCPAFIGATA